MKNPTAPRTSQKDKGSLSEAEVTRRVLARIKKMTPAEAFALAVSVGIYREDGTLTPEYGGELDPQR